VAEKTGKTIRIKWVRSGIGFTHHQKAIIRSLGLKKLNHTVVRPDTPQIRGIVAAAPHLLEIVPEPAAAAWASIPEYTVHPPAPRIAASGEGEIAAVPQPAAETTVVAEGVESSAGSGSATTQEADAKTE
jgi:large subunit ribosomal protein L30